MHSNLQDGLRALGHEVVLAGGRDGFKQLECDINLEGSRPGFLGSLQTRLKPFTALPSLIGYDVCQTINPFFPNARYFPKTLFYLTLLASNKSFFMLATGNDAFYWRHARDHLKYSPHEDFLRYDVRQDSFYMNNPSSYNYQRLLISKSNGVIPTIYDYEVGYLECPKRLKTIRLPLNSSKIDFRDNTVGRKLVIFHGLSRYGMKGTRHVEAAFEDLRSRYPSDLELIIDGGMPLPAYLNAMRRANVVIDQLNTYGSGMNALFALAMGKIVLGGAEPESLISLGVDHSPIINLEPSKSSVIQKIEWLLDNRQSISDMSWEGRRYVETVHNHIEVAEDYISTWIAAM